MHTGIITAAACALAVAACGGPEAPALEARDVTAYAPLPGTDVAVGYLTLTNRSDDEIVVHGARSPQFSRVEFHRSIARDGVARMLASPSLVVPADGEFRLQAGGHHLMLIDPIVDPVPGADIVIALDSTAGELVVRTALRSRNPTNDSRGP
ncbi:MAG: copper chaperone PCu(A)C [Woeseiaceae bacterium]|nr:copper chaperone PCu(A)C [Woeseiaceae bacterium]